jgi:hypothetical protein
MENHWSIHSKRTKAVWEGFTFDYSYKNTDFMEEVLTVLFSVGKMTKLLYTYEDFDIHYLIQKLVHSDKMYNLYDLSHDFGVEFKQELYINVEHKLMPKEFGYDTTIKVLRDMNYPEESIFMSQRLIPLKISINRQSVDISLYSDIFFPYVFCPWKWNEKYDDDMDIEIPRPIDFKQYGFDNKLIAEANTNRLNILIQEVKSVVKKYSNFNWQHTGSDGNMFTHMHDENGIFL